MFDDSVLNKTLSSLNGLVLTTNSVNIESSSWRGGMGRSGSNAATAVTLSWQWLISGWSLPLKQQENREDRRPGDCFTRTDMAITGASADEQTKEKAKRHFYKMCCHLLHSTAVNIFHCIPEMITSLTLPDKESVSMCISMILIFNLFATTGACYFLKVLYAPWYNFKLNWGTFSIWMNIHCSSFRTWKTSTLQGGHCQQWT